MAKKSKAQNCPYCGSAPVVLADMSSGVLVLHGSSPCPSWHKAVTNPKWKMPIELWNDIHPAQSNDELKSAYEQFRSSLEAEKEKMEEITEYFLAWKVAREAVGGDWEGLKHSFSKEMQAFISSVEKHADGEQ